MADTPDPRRLEHLETIVRALRDEVASLRREVHALATPNGREHTVAASDAAPASRGAELRVPELRDAELRAAESPAERAGVVTRPRASAATFGGPPPKYEATAARPARTDQLTAHAIHGRQLPASWSGLDVEEVVGRYGTTAIAAVLIMMGVGAFLTWAVSRGLLGPTVRVALGALAALAVASLGAWLRARGTRRFGNHLLALALAIIHVDAWAAGPYLQLIPSSAALAVAAAASLALAALALTDGEQTLFNVGAGGALLAPFVTSSESGRVMLLLAYGWVVIASSHAAVRPRRWRAAAWILFAGCAAYTIAALGVVLPRHTSWVRSDAPALFALLCAWSAFGLGSPEHRAGFSLRYVAIALVALLVTAVTRETALDVIPIAAAATASVYLMLEMRASAPAHGFAAALLLPLGFLGAALVALPAGSELAGAGVAAAWAAGAAFAAYSDEETRRAPHLIAFGLAGMAAVALALSGYRPASAVALAGYASALALLLRRTRAAALFVPMLAALALATAWAFELLQARPAYAYAPFLTLASAVALAVVAGWAMAAWQTARSAGSDATLAGLRNARVLDVAAAVVAVLWGREELGRAFSPELATFLLILYYAAVGVTAIQIGRWRSLPEARRAGLALAIYAALKAVVQASALTLVGLRVGSYLLVGSFLLAVAYWYRAASEPDAAVAEPAQP